MRRRCGHPLALACVGHELARRAGVQTAVHSCGSSWLLRFRDDRGDAFVAFGEPPRDGVDARRRCSQELAYATLVGLEERYRSCGFLARSRHAAELRELLPVMPR